MAQIQWNMSRLPVRCIDIHLCDDLYSKIVDSNWSHSPNIILRDQDRLADPIAPEALRIFRTHQVQVEGFSAPSLA